jgi:hypothetical protein
LLAGRREVGWPTVFALHRRAVSPRLLKSKRGVVGLGTMQPMDIAIAVLLISALTTTGLLALWAATSHRHWFLRTAAFLAVLSPLLLVPAYEPFVALALQGAVVASGVGIGRYALSRKRRRSVEGDEATGVGSQWRFSMATLLLAMVLCGVAAAIASQAPRLNRYAWQSVALIGTCGGVATLLGAWAANRRGWRRWTALFGVMIVAAAIAAGPAWFDWFLLSFHQFADWPPDPTSAVAAFYILPDRPLLHWFAIVPGTVLCVFLSVWLTTFAVKASSNVAGSETPRRKWLVWAALIASLVTISLPAASAMFCLLTPEPIPNEPLPSPNGYDDFVAAGKLLESPGGWQSYPGLGTPPTQAELQKEVDGARVALARGRVGLQREAAARADYLDGDLESMDELQALRNFGRALVSEGELREMQARPTQACESYLDCVEFGIRSIRGGMMVDGLVGFANALSGAKAAYKLRNALDAETCRSGARRILDALEQLEPKELLHHRDRIWSQHARGWHGRLLLGLTDLTNEHFMDLGPEAYLFAHDRNVAALRMLALELLVRAEFIDSGAWPRSPDELQSMAGAAPESMRDPFDPADGLLRMLSTEAGVKFYSVGENRIDDGGIAPNVETEDGTLVGGDLLLSEILKPLDGESLNVDEGDAGDVEADDPIGDD